MASQEDLVGNTPMTTEQLAALLAFLTPPEPPYETDSPSLNMAFRLWREDRPGARIRKKAKDYTVPNLLERLRLFDIRTASSSTGGKLTTHLNLFAYLGISRGKVPLGTLKGKNCILGIAELASGSLNDETPPKQQNMHWLLREVTLKGKNKEVLHSFKGITLGRIILNNIQSYWVALLSEHKDIWVLRAHKVDESELNERNEEEEYAKEIVTPENGCISSWYEEMGDLFDGVAVNVGTVEELKVVLEQEQDFLTLGNKKSLEGVCGWPSVLVPAPES